MLGNQKCIVLTKKPFQNVDKQTGEIKSQGVNVYYLMTDMLCPVSSPGLVGTEVFKGILTKQLSDKITVAPALYEFKFKTVAGEYGGVHTTLEDAEYISDLEALTN